jgi:limonene-1,2-epoxide hydrolase
MTETSTTATAVDALPARIKRFYERMSREREAALVELPELFTSDVRFQNPVGDYRGLDAFRRQWDRAFSQYKVFAVEGIEHVGDDRTFTMTYSMNIRMAFGPTFRVAMATEFHGRDGKVHAMRDYFDVVGTLVDPFPLVAWAYKKIFSLLVA